MHVRGSLDVKGSRIISRFAHFREEQSNTTDGQALSQSNWTTRTLNTILFNTFGGVSLSSNRITLPPDTYIVEASAQGYQCQHNKLRIQDVTNGTTLLVGQNVYSEITAFGSSTQTTAKLKGIITVTSTVQIELQHFCIESDAVTNEGGESVNTGANEIYAEIILSNY